LTSSERSAIRCSTVLATTSRCIRAEEAPSKQLTIATNLQQIRLKFVSLSLQSQGEESIGGRVS
jgi:hypothetical protein